MKNGKTNLLVDGYTFYKSYETKKLIRWICTSQPKCPANVRTDHNLVIIKAKTPHLHERRRLIKLNSAITMQNGKTNLLVDGYTFYKAYETKNLIKWNCTSLPKCTANVKIIMKNGKTNLVVDGYTFYKTNETKKLKRWICTSHPKCTATVITDHNLIIIRAKTSHSHERRRLLKLVSGRYIPITMENGKTNLLVDGYTFYKAYETKNLIKWICTSQPKCTANVSTDHNLVVIKIKTPHSHDRKNLLKLKSGRYIRV
ncbi:unnamed protein product [Leptidea sinapis]|uniref:FLYWCH-type domain-containing protein n=1 Tax=Leptidea sinapis TaxID=189913 RepID=A0A5E4PZH5_9NEOP|nr:unnamed protein product [Leptidea sinapis]